jgi:hypothetical protein
MTLQNPYPTIVILYNNPIDKENVTDRWVFCKSISNYDGVSSGQTNENGVTSIEMQDICNNNDTCRLYDGTFEHEYIVDTSFRPPKITVYQNASNAGDIYGTTYYNENEVYLKSDNYIDKDINLKTSDY